VEEELEFGLGTLFLLVTTIVLASSYWCKNATWKGMYSPIYE